MDYTKSQQAVLDTHHTNLLVSASAGSGKTRVLVDRVINMILDGESLENLLIVTFTRAAAKEMKDRIETALREHISTAQGEEQRYLNRQLALLSVADISTMDAFCQRIVERYYYLIDLDPVFRILADASESALLKEEVWADVRETLYADDDNGQFKALVENFSNDRSDDGLTDLVEQVFFFMNAKPNPQEWLESLPDAYSVNDGGLLQTPLIRDYFIGMVKERLATLQRALKQNLGLAQDEQAEKVVTYYQDLVSQVNTLTLNLSKLSWDELKTQLDQFSMGRRPTVTKKDPAYDGYQIVAEDVKQHHEQAKKALGVLQTLMPYSEAETSAVMQRSQTLVTELARVVSKFAAAYQQEKLRRHVLEFSDIEHYALQILTTQSEAANAVQAQLAVNYHEIMVDEYQDTNELQEAIVTSFAQSDPGNLFMVGDIKQSIYGFRLAEPKLFIDKFSQYQADPEAGTEITLAENFRSMKNVDDFTNLVFTQIMDETLGQINYTGPAKLVYGAKYYPADMVKQTELLIYETDATVDQGQDDVPDKSAGQVALVGQKIRELIASETPIWDRKKGEQRPMRYQDIAIIAPTRSNNLEIQDQFGRLNIPVQINDAQSYFKTTEVQIMMSLLQLIDNPYQDIALAAVLRSPIVGLNENELAYLRITDKTDDYYTALLRFVGHYETEFAGNAYADGLYPKVQQFLSQLSDFQDIARQQSLATVIWTIYQTTGFLDYVAGMPAGAQRQANLHALYDRARDYEQNGFKGLFQFVRFIERMQKNDNDLAEADTEATENAVQVTTIHGSKGLEYPVVFLLDTSRQFNMQDTMRNAVMDNDLGIGVNAFNPENRVMIESIPKAVIRDKMEKDTLAEEMRKLYVALTRAEQQLYIVGAVKTQEAAIKSWRDALMDSDLVLNATTRRSKKTYLDWIGMALERHPKAQFDPAATQLAELQDDATRFNVTFVTADDLVATEAQSRLIAGSTWLDDLKDRAAGADYTDVNVDRIDSVLNLQYRFQAETRTTAYQSVSEVKRLFEDPDLTQLGNYAPDWEAHHGNRFVSRDFKQPAFLQTVQAPTGASVGTATHLVLQEISLDEPVTLERVEAQIQKLVADQVLPVEVADKVKREQVVAFFDSPLGQAVLAHKATLRRETPFSLLLPAKDIFEDLTDSAPRLLIHGIIDGYYLNDDGQAVLFDYKTDFVPATDDGVDKVVSRYKGQLNLYALALTKMLGKPVAEKALYLLAPNREVRVN